MTTATLAEALGTEEIKLLLVDDLFPSIFNPPEATVKVIAMTAVPDPQGRQGPMTRGAGVAGVCRYCGCTEDDACRIPGGDACSWLDAHRTVCNAPRCVGQFHADDVAARLRDYRQAQMQGKPRHRRRRKVA